MTGATAPGVRHTVVLASAGTGKTWQLTSRFQQLLQAGVAPEQILATTFTRAAAGQILDRVLERLAEAADRDAAALQLLGRVLRHLDQFQVMTLDAVFLRQMWALGPLSGVGAGFLLAEDWDDQRLRADALELALEGIALPELVGLLRSLMRGGPRRSVHAALLAVIDSGCGMPPAVLARLFEPYFSTKPAGKGTGLGLATVYAIVEQCRAAIGVESEPGRGSRFEVYFPRQDTPAPAPPPETAPIEGLGGSETILLAEDDESVRELVADVLSGAGYHVLDGGLPLATLALAASYPGRIDLLLSDLVMPDLDGHELARRLLLLRPGLTTLFMSGYPGETPPEGSPISWLSKPVRPTHLLRAVREALDRAARSRGAS